MNSSLKLFTQSDILHQLGIDSLQKFLNHFADSDPQLTCLNAESPYFYSDLARLFTQLQSLSPRLCETLVLFETAALPEHHARLVALAQQKLPDLCVTEFHPLALALQLWLAAPECFDEGGLACPDDLSQVLDQSEENCRRRPEECRNSEKEQHGANEIASGFPLPIRWGEGLRERGSVHWQTPSSSDCPDRLSCRRLGNETLPVPASPIGLASAPPFQSSNLPSSHSVLELLRSLVTRYVILPEHAAEALALWIVHTYAFELRDVTTYLALESPVRRCGKTTLLNILSRLVNRPLVAANVSPSALYRAIEELRPTLMIDEADTFLKPNDELIGILNAGYHRATAYVLRVASERSKKYSPDRVSCRRRGNETLPSPDCPARVGRSSRGDEVPSEKSKFKNQNSEMEIGHDLAGPDHSPITNHKSRLVRFSCWCPKIIARIGRLPETLADRCIIIRMQRKTPNDQCERFRDFDMVAVRKDMVAVRKDLRQDCAQFLEDHRDAIISAKPEIPAALNDRAADIWEPLLAIADCAGGDWPARARAAALALSSDTFEDICPDRVGSLAPSDGERARERGHHTLHSTLDTRSSLLLDICRVFTTSGRDRIPTRELLEALNSQFTDRPWMQTRKGQRSTEMWLAQQLRPFGITPRTFRDQSSIARGYVREDFTEAFRRYIPAAEFEALAARPENPLINTSL